MKLSGTLIPVRPRSYQDLLDLALHVFVQHFGTLARIALFYVLPFFVLDLWLCIDSHNLDEQALAFTLLPQLIFLQAPWVTAGITLYLGKVMFLQPMELKAIRAELRQNWGKLILIHGVLRFGLIASLLAVWGRLDTSGDSYSAAFGFVTLLSIIAVIVRGMRPFINEIVILERVPLFTSPKQSHVISLTKRHVSLHGANSGLITARSLGSVIVALGLTYSLTASLWYFIELFVDTEHVYTWLLPICLSSCLWIVAIFFAVVRFLNYLDVRIRNEGWDVQLLTLVALESSESTART